MLEHPMTKPKSGKGFQGFFVVQKGFEEVENWA